MTVIGMTGETGGKLKSFCDILINVPERRTSFVQELHLPVYHTLCLMIENHFFGSEKIIICLTISPGHKKSDYEKGKQIKKEQKHFTGEPLSTTAQRVSPELSLDLFRISGREQQSRQTMAR